jgi:hypothetical protein
MSLACCQLCGAPVSRCTPLHACEHCAPGPRSFLYIFRSCQAVVLAFILSTLFIRTRLHPDNPRCPCQDPPYPNPFLTCMPHPTSVARATDSLFCARPATAHTTWARSSSPRWVPGRAPRPSMFQGALTRCEAAACLLSKFKGLCLGRPQIHMLFTAFSEQTLTVQRLPVFYKQRDNLFYPVRAQPGAAAESCAAT